MAEKKEVELTELLTIRQVARVLKVHPETLRRWDNEGHLKAVRVGSRRNKGDRRYRKEDIKRLIEGGRV